MLEGKLIIIPALGRLFRLFRKRGVRSAEFKNKFQKKEIKKIEIKQFNSELKEWLSA